MRQAAADWIEAEAPTVELLRRIWANRHAPGDSERLTAWVNERVEDYFARGGAKTIRRGTDVDVQTDYPCPDADCTRRFSRAAAAGAHAVHAHGYVSPNRARTKAATAPRPSAHPSPRSPARRADGGPAHPAPAAPEGLPASVVAIFFEDVSVATLTDLFGPDAQVGIVAGRGLAITR